MTFDGSRLIFLISQPRAGSTLLQRILAGHPDIRSSEEPWLMLPPIAALRGESLAEYDAALGRRFLRSFLATLPGGEDDYLEGVRRMYGYLYERALSASGERYFLDKTPRYHSIIPELRATFPAAPFLLLLRNPLAVLCSIFTTWTSERWFALERFRGDLLDAPALLARAAGADDPRTLVVSYEAFVREPEEHTEEICRWLDLDPIADLSRYGSRDGDWPLLQHQGFLAGHAEPRPERVEGWTGSLRDPQTWRLASDYLEALDPDVLGSLGYDADELRRTLAQHRPSTLRLRATIGLPHLLQLPPERRGIGDQALMHTSRILTRWATA